MVSMISYSCDPRRLRQTWTISPSGSSFFGAFAMMPPGGLRRYGNVADRCAEAQPGESEVPRFVVLEHDWPAVHWDLLLECGPVLRAWRLLAEPGPGRAVPAEPNFDHRPVYLDYEGPLSGDRGRVWRGGGGA